jgi:hypothetical protein
VERNAYFFSRSCFIHAFVVLFEVNSISENASKYMRSSCNENPYEPPLLRQERIVDIPIRVTDYWKLFGVYLCSTSGFVMIFAAYFLPDQITKFIYPVFAFVIPAAGCLLALVFSFRWIAKELRWLAIVAAVANFVMLSFCIAQYL